MTKPQDNVTISRKLLKQMLDTLSLVLTDLELQCQQLANPMIHYQIRLSDGSWVACSEQTYKYHIAMGWVARKVQVCPIGVLNG